MIKLPSGSDFRQDLRNEIVCRAALELLKCLRIGWGKPRQNNQAATAWRSFYDSFQAAHPDLPALQFLSDFQVAFSRKNLNGNRPWETVAQSTAATPNFIRRRVKLDVASTYGFALWKERTVPFPPYFGEVAGGRRKRGRNKRVILCYRG